MAASSRGGRGSLVSQIKGALTEAKAPQNREVALRLFLCARFGRSIPRATGLHAIGLGLCGGRPREGWTCEGKGEGHCKNRNKSFNGVFSLTLKLQQSLNSLSGNYVPRRLTLSWAETVMLSRTISNSGENHA